MPPNYVKPYVKHSKNNAADAAAICEAVIPKVLTIDSYDRHLYGFWLGAIGAVVRVPQANCNDIQNPQKSGLR